MKIEEQIQKLLRIKAKIDLYKLLIANINSEGNEESKEHAALKEAHPGLLGEFTEEIIAFATKRMEMLSNSGQANPVPPPAVVQAAPKPKAQIPAEDPNEEPKDPLKFLLKYKDLQGKRVTWTTPDGVVSGTVRGMVTPYLKIETDTGYVVTVEPKIIKVA